MGGGRIKERERIIRKRGIEGSGREREINMGLKERGRKRERK